MGNRDPWVLQWGSEIYTGQGPLFPACGTHSSQDTIANGSRAKPGIKDPSLARSQCPKHRPASSGTSCLQRPGRLRWGGAWWLPGWANSQDHKGSCQCWVALLRALRINEPQKWMRSNFALVHKYKASTLNSHEGKERGSSCKKTANKIERNFQSKCTFFKK
jgi:hypothetical protein